MASLEIKLPGFHSKQQHIYDNMRRFTIMRVGRQFGKSLMAAVVAIIRAQMKPNQVIIVVAPTYKQTQAIYGRIRTLLKPLFRQDMGDGTLFVTEYKADLRFDFHNGSSIMAASADNPDKLRGYSINLIIIDEAASMDKGEELWFEVVRPALAVTHGDAMFLSTPKGKDNWFYHLWKQSEYDIAEKGDNSEWALFHFKSTDSPYFSEAESEAIRAVGENYWRQEILAEFTAHAGTIIGPEAFKYYTTVIQESNLYFLHGAEMTPEASCYRAMTVDLALTKGTSSDYTAFALGDMTRYGTCFVRDVYRDKILGPDLANKIIGYAKRNAVQAIHIESTAFQLTVVQELERRGVTVAKLPAKGDKIARASLMGIRMNASQFLYQREAPWFSMVIDEVTTFPDDGAHDDMVDALAYLSHVSAQYAVDASPAVFGGVSLDQVAQAARHNPNEDREVLHATLRVEKMERDRQRAMERGEMALKRMRGPM